MAADSNIKLHPVALNQGLDLVTTPMLVEPGALIDCLNYEMTDVSGYRRIDGYEKYDGYPNGAIYDFYRVTITAVDGDDQALMQEGSVISRVTLGGNVDVGVIVGAFSPDTFDIVPRDSLDAFLTEEDFLELAGTDLGFLTLVSEAGLLRLLGGSTNDFIVTTPDGVEIPATVDSFPVSGRGIMTDPMEFLIQLREYGAVLRNLVGDAPTDIAGVYWYNDRLLAAVNTLSMNLVVLGSDPVIPTGTLVRWNGTLYRIIAVIKTTEGVNDTYSLSMYPVGVAAITDDNLVEVQANGTTDGTTWITGVNSTAQPSTTDSMYAVMGYFNNPLVSTSRGFTYLAPSYTFNYDAGVTQNSQIPPITLDQAADPTGAYWAVGSDGAVMKVRLTQVTQSGGSFATGTGTATGMAQVSIVSKVAGTRDYLKDNDEIHNAYPTTGTSRVFTINGSISPALLAGTGALKTQNTRYQWGTFNFYGQSSTLSAYGATGASRAFWATTNAYGEIATQTDLTKDMPKYVSFHANRLALAFAKGSVQLSVVGDPYDYSGVNGAIEIATGDDITGLLELPGDTLAIFGRRTIRKITGSADGDMVLGTISGNSGAFDYTACLVGADAVFTNNNGVSTLQQTADYGDFIGVRLSQKISNWLRPKLSKTGRSIEDGGVVMAYTVRNKGQYRLVLETGETICFSLNGERPTITFSNYALAGERKVPFAWSSEVSVDGQEHVHVVWYEPGQAKSVYELDSGWGFNGRTFRHYFDLSPLFDTQSGSYFGIEKVRMFGTSYGIATLDLKTSGVEKDFNQPYHDAVQDISMPYTPELLYVRSQPVTGVIDQANWGLGIKIRIQGSNPDNSIAIEPPHTCQVLVLHVRTEGVED